MAKNGILQFDMHQIYRIFHGEQDCYKN